MKRANKPTELPQQINQKPAPNNTAKTKGRFTDFNSFKKAMKSENTPEKGKHLIFNILQK